MLVIARTPLRISFFGGGSDYPAFYEKAEGAVLGTTINHYTHISLRLFECSFFDHTIRIAYSKTELVKSVGEIDHPSVRACLQHSPLKGNLDIHIFNDLPARTGLGSSSSFTVGFLHALKSVQGHLPTKEELAQEACYVEQQCIQENVGSQDQFHTSYGGLNFIRFSPQGITVEPIHAAENAQLLEKHLLVFYTGLTRYAHEVTREQIELTRQGRNDNALQEMVAMAYQGRELLLRSHGQKMIQEFGRLLGASWQRKKSLSSSISNPLIDAAYERALQAGAYGGKLCGAGGGGFLLFIAPPERHEAICQALSHLTPVRFAFETEGSTLIYRKS